MNYRTIILPEALKIIQSGDPSGFDVIAGLSSILGETGQSLDSLITQLETLHRNAVMGIKVLLRKKNTHRYFKSVRETSIKLVKLKVLLLVI